MIAAYVNTSSEAKEPCALCRRAHQLTRIRLSTDGGTDSVCGRCAAAAPEPLLHAAATRVTDESFLTFTERRYPRDRVMAVLLPDVDEGHSLPMLIAAADYIASTKIAISA
jgi:hypothetical protein